MPERYTFACPNYGSSHLDFTEKRLQAMRLWQ